MAKAHVCVLLVYLSIAVAAKKCANVKVKAFADSSGENLCSHCTTGFFTSTATGEND
jgi:hypothetical protein